MKSGIYLIFSKKNKSKKYIGSSVDIKKRISKHKSEIKRKIHGNYKLRLYFSKHGIDDFDYKVLEFCDKKYLKEKEQMYIDDIKPSFNIFKCSSSPLGYIHSEKSKQKIKIKNTGRKMTSEQIKKGVISRIGQKTSKGCKRTEEFKKHLSELKKKKIIYNGKIYSCLKDLSDEIGIKYSTLYAMLSGKNFNKLKIKYA